MSQHPQQKKVISLDKLRSMSRRDFCELVGAGAAAAAVLHTLGCSTGSGGADAAVDLATPPDQTMLPDLAGSSCPPTASDTGQTPDTFMLNTATFFMQDEVFVCRDANGIYALTSICTHEGCDVEFRNHGFTCPCHLARYSFDGTVTGGPAPTDLDHYAVCLTAMGTVAYDINTTVDKAKRYPY